MRPLLPAAVSLYLISSLCGCSLLPLLKNIERPSVTLDGVDIASISLTEITLRLRTVVANPYPIPFPASALGMNITVEGTDLAKIESKLQSIGPVSEENVPVDVKIAYRDLMTIYQKLPGKETLRLALKGNLSVPFPSGVNVPGIPGQLDLPFSAERDIPAVLPSISIRNFRLIRPEIQLSSPDTIKKAAQFLDGIFSRGQSSPGSAAASGLAGLDITIKTEFEILLKNEAAARIAFDALKYNLTLNNENFLAGTDTSIVNSGKESVIKVQTSFPIGSITAALADALRQKGAAFHLTGSSAISIPGLAGESIPFQFDRTGNLTW